MTHAFIFLLTLVGFALLLFATPRHQQDWLRRKLPAALSHNLRLSGLAALALAFIVAGADLGWGYGAVAWFGWLTIGAALVVAADTNRERIVKMVRPHSSS